MRRVLASSHGHLPSLTTMSEAGEEPNASGESKGKSPRSRGSLLWKKMKKLEGTMDRVTDLTSGIGREGNKMMLLEEHNGIPIKETMKVLYSVRRMKFVWEIIVLSFTLALFYFTTSEPLNRRTAYEQELSIIEAIQDEEFQGSTYKKNFLEIRSEEEFWQWAEGPLISALYSAKADSADHHVDYMNSYLRLVGGIQLRQFRVRDNSCVDRRRVQEWDSNLDTKDGSCFSRYGYDVSNKTVPSWATAWATESSRLIGHWGHCGQNNCPTFMHDEVIYGHGGFYIEIPPPSKLLPFNASSQTTALAMIQSLRDKNFFDRGTRAVAVEAAFYNTNTGILTASRYVVEQFPSALLEAHAKYRHAGPSLFDSNTSKFRTMCEGFYLILMLYQFQREVKRMLYTRPILRWWQDPFSYMELIYFFCHFIYVKEWYAFVNSPKRKSFDVNVGTFVSYFDMGHDLFLMWQWAGFAFLLGIFKLMRFFSLNRRVSVMWQAIYDR